MHWDDAVRQGRRLVALENKCKWELGDLALGVAPMATRGGHGDGSVEAQLNRFAEEIGASYESLDAYRHVSHRWPTKSRRLDLSWSVHHAMSSIGEAHDHEEREKAIHSRERWTVREAREFVRALRAPDELPDWELRPAELCRACLHVLGWDDEDAA